MEVDLWHEYCRNGSQFPANSQIVAAGPNACVLHYVSNDGRLAQGDLLLIDAGCELDGYASDITRTFPVSGRFSGAQRAVYDLVLAAQRAAIERVKPGNGWNEPHDAAVRVLAQGMLDLNLLSGSLDQVLEKETYKRFYMHRTGHWLGLDVHDAGEYKRSGNWRRLAPGMALTVEPEPVAGAVHVDRKSTRLNSRHTVISYAVFCFKKKKHTSELQSHSDLVCRLLLQIQREHV